MNRLFLIWILFGSVIFLNSCSDEKKEEVVTQAPEIEEVENIDIQIQGHRGCRGLYPENSIPGFIHALELGVDVLEMDVVISKDQQVVVSHEPWLNPDICSSPSGRKLEEEAVSIIKYNLYQMNYEDIRKYQCGLMDYERFPHQQKISTYKPLLSEVIDSVRTYCMAKNIPLPEFNIELKYISLSKDIYHPGPEDFAELVLEVVNSEGIDKVCTFQSFSVEMLEALHKVHPKRLVYLVENDDSYHENISKLSFVPDVYSPDFNELTKRDMKDMKLTGVKCIPWTVNTKKDMKKLIDLGVDGIITDYPDSLMTLIKR